MYLSAVDTIIEAKPDVLIHAGDLFDTLTPKTRAYTTVTGRWNSSMPPGSWHFKANQTRITADHNAYQDPDGASQLQHVRL
jgi:hypothetical protein